MTENTSIVSPQNDYDGTDVPIIRAPIQIDYGINVRIEPSCFINRDCFIQTHPNARFLPESTLSLGSVPGYWVLHIQKIGEKERRDEARVWREMLLLGRIVSLELM